MSGIASGNIKFTPYWWEAAPQPVRESVELPASAEVVVIGAGFTGLSAALTLANKSSNVLVLDAQDAGFGCSTRNGGQVGTGLQGFSVKKLVDTYGYERAHQMYGQGLDMVEYLFELVERENIQCELARVGRYRAAMNAKHFDTMARELDSLREFVNFQGFMVPQSQQHEETGSEYYHGGMVLSRDAGVHPGLLHQGLLDSAKSKGAQVIGHCPVIGITRNGGKFQVATTHGEITVDKVIVATNGYTTNKLPYLHKRLAKPQSAMIATEELAPDLITELFPRHRMMGETRRIFLYYRPSPDGKRVLMGGRAKTEKRESSAAYTHLYNAMIEIYPQLKGVKISHAWQGTITVTHDGLPHIGEHEGIHYAAGYCGSGVSRSVWFGNKVALQALGDINGNTAYDNKAFTPWTAIEQSRFAINTFIAWNRLRDKLERLHK